MPITNHPMLAVNVTDHDVLKEWREHSLSLTDKLKNKTGSVELHILSQHWTTSGWWDKYVLEIVDSRVFEREILMKHQQSTYWYARSIIPKSCYLLDPDFFNRLQHESIRNLIFGEERVVRTNMHCYPINEQCIEFYWINKYLNQAAGVIHEPLWVRLVEYSFLQQGAFYLIEILFPELGHLDD